jgi:hypothetical protein
MAGSSTRSVAVFAGTSLDSLLSIRSHVSVDFVVSMVMVLLLCSVAVVDCCLDSTM